MVTNPPVDNAGGFLLVTSPMSGQVEYKVLRRRLLAKARRDKIRADPVLREKFRAQKRKWELGRAERVRNDPVRLARRMETQRRNARSKMARIALDPVLYAEHCERVSASARKRYKHLRATSQEFVLKHRARISRYNKTEKGRAIQNETQKRLRSSSVSFNLAHQCRNRIAAAISGRKKFGKLNELVGCSMEDLKAYLQSRFSDGMSWDNWGRGHNKWNIDHIKPLAAFDLSDPEQQKLAFHYTNLQPLWYLDNCAKNSIVDGVKARYSDHITL